MDSINSYFESIVSQYEFNNAIFYEGKYINYKQLNEMSNKLGWYIKSKTFGKQLPIALFVDRNEYLIVSILGILKSGCPYVPLDKNYPIERLSFIINDVKPQVIITDNDLKNIINLDDQITIINLKDDYEKIFTPVPILEKNMLKATYNINDLAYIIYTSGTTGTPKGVIITQNGVLNLIKSAIKHLEVNSSSRILQYASIGFDAAGWDIYMALFSGGCIYMVTNEMMRLPVTLHGYMIKNKINIATVTPAFLSQMPLEPINSLSRLVVMGDLADAKNMEFWYKFCTVYNGYGPTETTIGATIHTFKPGDSSNNIGKPFDNYYIYLLDDNLCEVKNGEMGEICIGGIGVAKGYLNREELTKEKFIDTNYGRLYRSGDMARLLDNDEYEFIGRKDNQIKINGVRIELEEVETLALKLNYIIRACANFNNKFLTLYYITDRVNDDEIINNEIREHLQKYLHTSVVPSRLIRVNTFKLTANGKIDKKSLPEFVIKYSEPRNDIERLLVSIYKDVLEVDDFGIDSNYYENGGNSLKSFKIISQLRKNGFTVNDSDVLKYPIICDLIHHLKKYQQYDIANINSSSYPLSPFQMDLWYHQMIYPSNYSYNMPIVLTIKNNPDKILQSLKYIFRKHSVLNTKISLVDNIPYQSFNINDNFIDNIKVEHLSDDQINKEISDDIRKPFILTDSVIRIRLFKLVYYDNLHILMFIKHNIITDLYSENLILDDFESFLNSDNITSETSNNYGKFVISIEDKFTARINDYWKYNLANCVALKLPTTQLNHKNSQNKIYKKINIINKLECLSKQYNTSLYNLLITCFNILLFKFTHQKDISFGTQIALRDDEDYNYVAGFMVSTVIIRNLIDTKEHFKDLLRKVSKCFYNALDNKYIKYSDLMKYYRKGDRDNVLDIMFNFRNMKHHHLLLSNVADKYYHHNDAMFPLNWNISIDDNELVMEINHSDKYDNNMIIHMLEVYETILHNICDSYDPIIDDIKYLPFDHIIRGDNININGLTIINLIDSITHQFPSNIALKYSSGDANSLNNTMTYIDLFNKSNQIAHKLINSYNIIPGDIVGISLRRSMELVCCLIAILKVGGTYVPIDADFPKDRIDYMINDCKPKIIIVNYGSKIVNYPCILVDKLLLNETKLIPNINKSEQSLPAYLIYTSGSTGKPKGCLITHKSITNVLLNYKKELDVTYYDQIWNLTSISFDIMVLELFLPLITGATLLICPQCVSSNPVLLTQWINKEMPTIIQATPTQYSLIVKHLHKNKLLRILVGGESLTIKLANDLLDVTDNVYNVYGPSETTIWSLTSKITKHSLPIMIGKPITNTQCLILDKSHKPVVKGISGELYIGGDGLSLGYFNRKELTESRFVTIEGSRYYKTGDIVIQHYNDEIQYLNREDFQIKIRGHRIELDEIVNLMESLPYINKAFVTSKSNDDDTYLIGYYTGYEQTEPYLILEYLRSKLPLYMVPNYILYLPRFPETLNGKIDPNKLPNPFTSERLTNYTLLSEYIHPRTILETQVHEIWTKILQIDKISVTESILNLGATSIMFPTFVNEMNAKFGSNITIGEFIINSTIEKCSNLISLSTTKD